MMYLTEPGLPIVARGGKIMAKFAIGEIAIIINSINAEFIGIECEVISNLFKAFPDRPAGYVINIPGFNPSDYYNKKRFFVEEYAIRKRFEAGKWEDCIWRPNEFNKNSPERRNVDSVTSRKI